jgi:hypothetical protein
MWHGPCPAQRRWFWDISCLDALGSQLLLELLLVLGSLAQHDDKPFIVKVDCSNTSHAQKKGAGVWVQALGLQRAARAPEHL